MQWVCRVAGGSSSGPAEDAAVTHDGSHHDAGHADAKKPDSGKADAGKADSAKAEAGKPDSAKADTGKPDSGKTDSGKPDSGKADASGTDAGDAGPDCGTIPPVGTQIVASTDPLVLQGQGLTSDGYAFYEDTNTQVLYVVPAAGGSPANLGSMTSQGRTFYLNGGKAVLFLPAAANPNTGLAPLSAWTAASGPAAISTGAFAYDSFDYTYDVTQDGTEVVYFSGQAGFTASLTVSSIDGKSQKTLVQNIDLTNEYCSPTAQFVNHTVVAYYCLAAPVGDAAVGEAGVGALTIASFASPAYTQVTLVTAPAPTANTALYGPGPVSPDGSKLLLSPYQDAPDLALYPLAGGAPTTVDPNGVQGGFLPKGDVVYVTQSGAMMLYSTTDAGVADAGGSLTLVTGGVGGLMTLSPDGNWLQVASAENQYYFTNLFLASATTPGPLTTLWSPTSAYAFGFTPDSKFETFGTNLSTTFGNNSFDSGGLAGVRRLGTDEDPHERREPRVHHGREDSDQRQRQRDDGKCGHGDAGSERSHGGFLARQPGRPELLLRERLGPDRLLVALRAHGRVWHLDGVRALGGRPNDDRNVGVRRERDHLETSNDGEGTVHNGTDKISDVSCSVATLGLRKQPVRVDERCRTPGEAGHRFARHGPEAGHWPARHGHHEASPGQWLARRGLARQRRTRQRFVRCRRARERHRREYVEVPVPRRTVW